MPTAPTTRRGFITFLAALPAMAVVAKSNEPDVVEKAAEKSYDAIVEWLRADEWTMGNGQCHECCGLAPDGTIVGSPGNTHTTSWGGGRGHQKRETGHRPTCKLAMSLELLGAPAKWAYPAKL